MVVARTKIIGEREGRITSVSEKGREVSQEGEKGQKVKVYERVSVRVLEREEERKQRIRAHWRRDSKSENGKHRRKEN